LPDRRFCLGNELHALLIAAYAGTNNREFSVRAASRDCRRSRRGYVRCASANTADAANSTGTRNDDGYG
jgi:hypothetical protein